MVYTLTLNPALDYYLELETLHLGKTNRSIQERLLAGGKGINVSIMLKHLGIENQALGFLAGFSGEELLRCLQAQDLNARFIFLKNGHTRINLKLKAQLETEINAHGAVPSEEEVEMLFHLLEGIDLGDYLVLSGSLAQGLESDFYAKIMQKCTQASIVLDTTGEALQAALPYRPFLIKPNRSELQEFFAHEISSMQDLIEDGKKLQAMGARNVLISLGAEGGVLIDETQRVHTLGVPSGKLINSVGAGDSMVAGFLAGFLKTQDYKIAFDYALASGSASAYCEGFATLQDVQKLLQMIKEDI